MRVLPFLVIWQAGFVTVEARLSMPRWLQKQTRMNDWPEGDAPYIYEPKYNPAEIPFSDARRQLGECNESWPSKEMCSFDCNNCIEASDVSHCSTLSQTFDDGPTRATVKLLNFLRRKRTKTTFFVVGQNVVAYPAVVRAEKREGHLVAVHTWSHRYLPALSNEEVLAELQWCIWAIQASTGTTPKYFRPPYGGIDSRIRALAKVLGLVPVLWKHDTLDWELNIGSRTEDQVLQDASKWIKPEFLPEPRPGLILEHDLTWATVDLAMKLHRQLPPNQKRVDQC